MLKTVADIYQKAHDALEWLIGFIYGVVVYLQLNADTLQILFWLMVIDTFAGAVKSTRLNNKFSFKKLMGGFVSKLAIFVVPLTVALLGKGLSFDFSFFVNAVINVLLVSEGISIFSNALAIKTRKEVENIDIVTRLIKAIRNSLIKISGGLINSIEDNENHNNHENNSSAT